MNRSEAALLLGHCAAFDNRTVGKADATAWAAALGDIPYDDDARNAVARFYGTAPRKEGEKLWIQPHHVRAVRRTIRSERLENFLYEPAGDETPAQYLLRLRDQQDAIASGRVPQPARQAIKGGPHLSVLLAIEGARIGNPDEDQAVAAVRRAGPLGIVCPQCDAAIGRPCRMAGGTEKQPLGKPRKNPHPDRIAAATGKPYPTAEERRQQEERTRQMSIAALARLQADNELHDDELIEPERQAS
ncbi:hypothetical protein AVW11_03845 [Streptomyces amritsarensis]|uniref:DNA-binding phage zinc finger domain-containing protein n=1 Tax=Streptomyces amritsarensis TaxID=681158 RepID=A0ABX3GBT8_9ACTN|nr:hypothetical protein [Streptomyces amritsarensis]OLZ72535.1 hypothetical protein AVW11_03845 [Streptomyces amritsarensis]